MKIVHIAPSAPYNDYWGYQDNLLPKYQRKLGHEVTMITTNTMHKDGKIVETDCGDYVLNDGVRVIRLKRKQYPNQIFTNLNSRLEVFPYLKQIRPDFIFFHGLVSTSIYDVIKYVKCVNGMCIVVQDNHLDFYNGRSAKDPKGIVIRAFYRHVSRRSKSVVMKVYGVTPWRVKYAVDYFKVPSSKTDLLMMGADDEHIRFSNKKEIRNRIRHQYGVAENEFLIVTGGKIDKEKRILEVMDAIRNLQNVKMLIFGSVVPGLQREFNDRYSQSDNIIYIGWVPSEKVYDYFISADLVCFPGSHSVLWEQACACKIPCLFSKWDGMDHVNNGGNSDFLHDVTPDSIREKIISLHFTDKYKKMVEVANSSATDIYLYSEIAKKSLECMTQI